MPNRDSDGAESQYRVVLNGANTHFTIDADSLTNGYGEFSSAEITFWVDPTMELVADSVSVAGSDFDVSGKDGLVSLGNGYWKMSLDFLSGHDYTEEDSSVKLSYSASHSSAEFAAGRTILPRAEFVLRSYMNEYAQENNIVLNCFSVTSPLTDTIETISAVTVTPADMTVYEGGEDGYEGAFDSNAGEGEANTGSDSLPHPLFEITAPKGTNISPENLVFSTGEGESTKTWAVKRAGDDLYYFVPTEGRDPVRVTYTNAEGETVLEDEFSPDTDLYASYRIDLYPGENDLGDVTAKTSDEGATAYPISVNSGTLTVRAVDADDPNDVTYSVSDDAPASKLATGTAAVSAPKGTTYTLNDTEVPVPTQGSDVSLLFDDIIDDAVNNRTQALLGKASADAETAQAKYLDLVDANNGNAWVRASGEVTVYWAYPEGTDKNTEFTLWHFPGLHRDNSGNGSSGFNVADLENVTPEEVKVTPGDNALSFFVASGGFSPYVLTWENEPDTPVIPPTTRYTITATAGEGGSISPSGKVTVSAGADKTFTITPDEGNKVMNVTIDGKAYGPLGSYTFEDVRANHTISVAFTRGNAPADPSDTGVDQWFDVTNHNAFLNGYGDGSGIFGPDNVMTRAGAAQMFYNMLKDKSRGDVDATFSDVEEGAWYYEAIMTLTSHGIIEGYSDGTFKPAQPVARAEFIAMAMRFTKGDMSGENIFEDVSEGDWYYDYVVGSVKYGWIIGYQDGNGHRFGPTDTLARCQATAIANRMLGRVADGVWINEHLDDDSLKLFPDVTPEHWAFLDIVEATNSHDYTKDGGFEHWTGLKEE